ncbi:Uncharacterised protein [Candidatus Gugararchaeum adminiculabundum]|nr:Uncharacterised protein [Candidatus Gugararchaeum adminiculabundum]
MSKQIVLKEIWTDDPKIAEKFHLLLRDKSSGEEFFINTFDDLKKVEEAERKGVERVFLK